MLRSVLHLDIAAFGIAVERVVDPALRGRPVVVAPVGTSRAVVVTVSLEARLWGIHRGMLLEAAARRCPDLVALPPNQRLYRRATGSVFDIVTRYTPVVEPSPSGRFFLDMTGTHRLFGAVQDAGARIQREIERRLRLEPAVGAATNKLLSRVAAKIMRPDGLCDVFPGGEAAFLEPLEVALLPRLGPEMRHQLDELNLRIIRELAAVPLPELMMVFGSRGRLLYRNARGVDETPVRPVERAPSVIEEELLEEDTNNREVLHAALRRMVERGAGRLRDQGVMARAMEIRIRYADSVEAFRCRPLVRVPPVEARLFDIARRWFDALCTRRIRVRYLEIRFRDLHRMPRQLELFGAGMRDQRRDFSLAQAVDAIRRRFGDGAVTGALRTGNRSGNGRRPGTTRPAGRAVP
jgi:DNA polymerase-4